jgi:hypothetical protein
MKAIKPSIEVAGTRKEIIKMPHNPRPKTSPVAFVPPFVNDKATQKRLII